MRNYLLLLALAGARACTPGTNLPNAKKCCPDGTESPYYNGGVGYACCGEGLAFPFVTLLSFSELHPPRILAPENLL